MIDARSLRLLPTPIPLSSTGYMGLVRFHQYFWYWPCRMVEQLVMRGTTEIELGLVDLDPSYRYVIASNHQSAADPFVICSAVPLALWPRLGVFRYMAQARLFDVKWLRLPLLAFGSFPAKAAGTLPHGLEASRAYLGRGQTVVMFPEGRRTLPRQTEGRAGIERLGLDPLVRIIPVHLQWSRGWRRAYRLTIGRPMAPHQSTKAVIEAIYGLHLPSAE